MNQTAKEILTTIQNLFGDEIFHEPGKLKAAMADLFAGDGYKKSRNLLNIAFADLRAYSRIISLERTSPLIIDILSKEMSRDYDILEPSARAVISCIGEIAGITPSDEPFVISPAHKIHLTEPLVIGDVVFFGKHYWRVLKVNEIQATVICEEIIGFRRYDHHDKCRDWLSSELRQYLNETFYNKFTPADRARIMPIKNDHSHDPERSTIDNISLLHPSDANILFDDNIDRICKYNKNPCSWWLLSDPGTNSRNATIVTTTGKISDLAAAAEGGIRPVICIKL